VSALYHKFVLENGIRVVTERIPTLKSVTVGIWVNTGSRDEQPSQSGFSHFIEHMFFKGTESRSATEISREIDALGGEMNAFTTRETTTFYVKFWIRTSIGPWNCSPICSIAHALTRKKSRKKSKLCWRKFGWSRTIQKISYRSSTRVRYWDVTRWADRS